VPSPNCQLELAYAVAAQRAARLLEPDNSASGLLPLEEAVASGRAYFVVPRCDLLVVDADLPDDPVAARQRASDFDLLIETAGRSGVQHVVVASGRAGHRHGYLLLGEGHYRQLVERWCRERGLDLRSRGIRPPGAPHRDGRHVAAPIFPHDLSQVLAVLSSAVDPGAVSRFARGLVPVQLPARVRSAMRHGHAAAGYESPSHARMALAVAIRSRSGPFSLLEMLLGDRSSPLGATFRARPYRWQQHELHRLWEKAEAWLRHRPARSRSDSQIASWAAAVAAHRWSGMAGGTDLAVAEALAVVARRAGTVSVGVALADLAVAAGISGDTARASVRRLLASGWLSVVAEATPRTSRVYKLLVPAQHAAAVPRVLPSAAADSPPVPASSGWQDLGSDLARWGALGKVTVRVARTLLAAGRCSAAELAEKLQMRPATVRYHLRKLAAHGLTERQGPSWVSMISPGAEEELAARLGVAGRRDRQRAELVDLRAHRAALLHRYRLVWIAERGGGNPAVRLAS
jgi:DNA-binding transcriptional ArsR family regulator